MSECSNVVRFTLWPLFLVLFCHSKVTCELWVPRPPCWKKRRQRFENVHTIAIHQYYMNVGNTKLSFYNFVSKFTLERIKVSLAIWNSDITFESRTSASIYSERFRAMHPSKFKSSISSNTSFTNTKRALS